MLPLLLLTMCIILMATCSKRFPCGAVKISEMSPSDKGQPLEGMFLITQSAHCAANVIIARASSGAVCLWPHHPLELCPTKFLLIIHGWPNKFSPASFLLAIYSPQHVAQPEAVSSIICVPESQPGQAVALVEDSGSSSTRSALEGSSRSDNRDLGGSRADGNLGGSSSSFRTVAMPNTILRMLV